MEIINKINSIKSGETLYLKGGKYDIFAENPLVVDRFFPGYGEQRKYLCQIKNKKNITIDGGGADLIFHGDISPFNFVNCEKITLKNFNIDFAVPGYALGKITAVTKGCFDLDFNESDFCTEVTKDGSLRLFDKTGEREAVLRTTMIDEVDTETLIFKGVKYFLRVDPWEEGELLGSMYRKTRFEELGKNKIRIYVEQKPENPMIHTKGNYIFFDVSHRGNVNFEFDGCNDIVMENINQYCSIGLAVITTNCKNLYANNVNSVVRQGSNRIQAVKDDVFHLVATKGEVVIKNCTFDRMCDDALNIHSHYPTIKKVLSKNTLVTEIICPQDKMLDLYRTGQTLKLLKDDYTDTGKFYTVKEHSYYSEKQIKLVLCEEIEENIEGFLLDDSEASATLLFCNNKVTNTNGRVVVQTSGKAIVENNYFHTVASAIVVNGRSKTYFEGAPIRDLIIRNNVFDGFGFFPAVHVSWGCYNPENKVIYGKITVENNEFTANGKDYMFFKYFNEVILKNNTFKQNPAYIKRNDRGEKGYTFEFCNKVTDE